MSGEMDNSGKREMDNSGKREMGREWRGKGVQTLSAYPYRYSKLCLYSLCTSRRHVLCT